MRAGAARRQRAHMVVVGGGILASRLLGLARDCVFAAIWGTSLPLAAFLTAFTVPNLFRALFGEGAFAAAFVPTFSEDLANRGQDEAWRAALKVIATMAVVLLGLVAVAGGVALAVRGLTADELWRLTLALLPWLLPYAALICLSAAFAGALQSLNRFGIPAFSQLLLNIFLIGAALAGGYLYGNGSPPPVRLLVAAVLAAGAGQLALHLWAARAAGCRGWPRVAFRDPAVRRVAWLMAPAAVGAGVMQLNVMVDRILACWLGSSAVTTLYYSQRLVYLPVGLFAVAASTVSLPAMAKAWAGNDREGVADILAAAFRQTLFLALPATVGLGVVNSAVVSLLFQRGSFGPKAADSTAWTLLFYLPGIPAFACVKIAASAFHARKDTRTPVKIALVCLALNVVLNLVLMQFLRQGGLALATTICSYLNLTLLLVVLHRTMDLRGLKGLRNSLVRIGVATALCGLVALVVQRFVPATGSGLMPRLLAVAIPTIAGGAVYLLAAWRLGLMAQGGAARGATNSETREE